MDLKQIITELEKIKRDLPKEAEKIALKYKSKILDYIREDQLFDKGIDGNGIVLGVYKSTYDGNGKGYPKIKGTRFNFFDTGGLTGKMDLFLTDQLSLAIFSRDSKYPELIEDYPKMFTFTADNIKEIDTEIFETKLIEWILQNKIFTMI